MLIKIRFNTDTLKSPDAGLPEWRVLYEGAQHFARHIDIRVPSWTTRDEIEPGLWKWHMSCEGRPEWDVSKEKLAIVSE